MNSLSLRTLSLIAVVVSCLVQAGAQLFAIVIVVSTVSAAPPRSLAMLGGEYGYNSSAFWDVVPMVTSLLLLVALAMNWKTARRRFVLAALLTFVVTALFVAFVMGPVQAEVVSVGYRDAIDEALRARAAHWRMLEWVSCALTMLTGLLLCVALAMPVTERAHDH
jgi:hypothetical protein